MIYRLLSLLSLALLLSAAVAQESDTETGDDEQAVEQTDDEEAAEEIDESGLDVQGFEEEDEDDFVPTEDIPTDQSIPFPTDI